MNSKVEKFYSRLEGLLSRHSIFLRDKERNRAYYRALRKHVKPGMKVLDIGSGTGIWAIVAAKLGARKAVAVNRGSVTFELWLTRKTVKWFRISCKDGTNSEIRSFSHMFSMRSFK